MFLLTRPVAETTVWRIGDFWTGNDGEGAILAKYELLFPKFAFRDSGEKWQIIRVVGLYSRVRQMSPPKNYVLPQKSGIHLKIIGFKMVIWIEFHTKLTSQKIPWSRVLQKSSASQIPRIIWDPVACYRFQKGSPLDPILSQINRLYAFQSTSGRSILILSSHQSICLPSGLFPSGLHTKTIYTPLLFSVHAKCPAKLVIINLITRIIFGEQYRSLSSS